MSADVNLLSVLPLLLLFIPILLVGIWVLVTYGLSRGGWSSLAEHFSGGVGGGGSLTGGWVGAVRYKGTLWFDMGEDGLRLSVLAPFSLGHAPLRTPCPPCAPSRRNRPSWWRW